MTTIYLTRAEYDRLVCEHPEFMASKHWLGTDREWGFGGVSVCCTVGVADHICGMLYPMHTPQSVLD